MEKPFQLELFKSHQYRPDGFKKPEYRQNFFGFIKLHEKAISIVIVLLITSLVSFSFGVEKGRRLARANKEGVTKDEGLTEQEQPQKKRTQPKEFQRQQTLRANRLEEKRAISKYTIQVATFKTRKYAQKEAEKLKRKGLKALIITRGNFVEVCVGNFSKKQEASIPLNQLKKTYRDCFIRRL